MPTTRPGLPEGQRRKIVCDTVCDTKRPLLEWFVLVIGAGGTDCRCR